MILGIRGIEESSVYQDIFDRGSTRRAALSLPAGQAVTLGLALGEPAEVEPLGRRFLASGPA